MVQVAERLGRPHNAVKQQASKYGIRFARRAWGVEQRAWTPEEDTLIRELASQAAYAEIGLLCGRSESSIKTRAGQLGIRGRSKAEYATRGPDNPRYRGGTKASYRGEDWPEVRLLVLERDGYSCQTCGLYVPSGNGLVVHHLIPYRLRPVNDLLWLLTLCVKHHLPRPEHFWLTIPEDVQEQLRSTR
jgi:hypothetical protein